MEVIQDTTLTRPAPTAAPAPSFKRLSRRRWLKDNAARRLFGLAAAAICLLVLAITLTLVARAWPILQTYSVRQLLAGQAWQPMRGLFGFAPFIAGSLAVTAVAM
ncbi:MAG TPA: hypothetical protein VK879_22995, partial [Candidatus Sulfomarinibacteraceae bacterium]|nr:hypothetical protein [Candidatus Sulfomarinibacteraceae bacterium]